MPPTVQVGTILIEEGPLMTRVLGLESEPYLGKWNLVKALDGFALDRKIHAAGWNFFFMAAEVRVMFFGVLGAKKIQNALRRILRKSEGAGLQLPRSYWDRCQEFLGCASSVAFLSNHMAKSRWEIENQGYNDAKNRYGFEDICHHHANSVLISWLLSLLAMVIERLTENYFFPIAPPSGRPLRPLSLLSLATLAPSPNQKFRNR